jgi:hypothetical protein
MDRSPRPSLRTSPSSTSRSPRQSTTSRLSSSTPRPSGPSLLPSRLVPSDWPACSRPPSPGYVPLLSLSSHVVLMLYVYKVRGRVLPRCRRRWSHLLNGRTKKEIERRLLFFIQGKCTNGIPSLPFLSNPCSRLPREERKGKR